MGIQGRQTNSKEFKIIYENHCDHNHVQCTRQTAHYAFGNGKSTASRPTQCYGNGIPNVTEVKVHLHIKQKSSLMRSQCELSILGGWHFFVMSILHPFSKIPVLLQESGQYLP